MDQERRRNAQTEEAILYESQETYPRGKRRSAWTVERCKRGVSQTFHARGMTKELNWGSSREPKEVRRRFQKGADAGSGWEGPKQKKKKKKGSRFYRSKKPWLVSPDLDKRGTRKEKGGPCGFWWGGITTARLRERNVDGESRTESRKISNIPSQFQ